ncbi:MAG: hypothetical protein NTV57_02270 [Cyanobacteria bacterium]|nr:hypothetical protein [Cyanobacteriota bacterium]
MKHHRHRQQKTGQGQKGRHCQMAMHDWSHEQCNHRAGTVDPEAWYKMKEDHCQRQQAADTMQKVEPGPLKLFVSHDFVPSSFARGSSNAAPAKESDGPFFS